MEASTSECMPWIEINSIFWCSALWVISNPLYVPPTFSFPPKPPPPPSADDEVVYSGDFGSGVGWEDEEEKEAEEENAEEAEEEEEEVGEVDDGGYIW